LLGATSLPLRQRLNVLSAPWTVKGTFSTLKEKYQEPSDASAPVNKFYYDSINMFQGLHDLSDSESEVDELGDSSPRTSGTAPEKDAPSFLNAPIAFLRTASRTIPPKAKAKFIR